MVQINVLNLLEGEAFMVCATCERRIADCQCQKNNQLVKNWPTQTWLQKRLKKVRIAQTNGHEPEREGERGYAFLQVLCFLAVAGLIVTALLTFGVFARGVVENLQSVDHCIKALLECVNI